VGWSIAYHLQSELVSGSRDMNRLRGDPQPTIIRSDHGPQYCSRLYEHRICPTGSLGSMGTVDDALHNIVQESFFASLQCQLSDRQQQTRAESDRAIFH
jgi:hypothetical protein